MLGRAVNWVKGLQNNDGGWGAFEKGVTKRILANLPIENASDMITDPSTPDITGRVLEFLGHMRKMNCPRNKTKCDKLVNECTRGKWIMVWEMGNLLYIYGTWAVLTGLRSLGIPSSDPSLKRAALWLEHIQHEDGGTGESCQSSVEKDLLLCV